MRMTFNLVALLGLAPLLSPTGVSALIFTNLYVFSAGSYGTAAAGGLFGYGTLFRLDLASEHFTNLLATAVYLS